MKNKMKNKIEKELSYILDDNVVGFFSSTVSYEKKLKRYTSTITITTISDKKIPKEESAQISEKLHELGNIISKIYNAKE